LTKSSFMQSTVFIYPDVREKRTGVKCTASKATFLPEDLVGAFDGDDRPRILIMAETPSHAPKLLNLAKEILADGRLLPVLAVVSHIPRSRKLILGRFRAALAGAPWSISPPWNSAPDVDLGGAAGAGTAYDGRNGRVGGPVKKLVASALGPAADFVREALKFRRMVLNNFRFHRQERRDAELILDWIAPNAVIYIDISSFCSSVIATAARKRGFRNFAIQMKNWPEKGIMYKRKKRDLFAIDAPQFRFWKKSIALFLPNQVWRDHEKAVLFYNSWETVGRWLARALPRDPWAFHGGLSDMVAMWDDNVKKDLLSRGTMGRNYVTVGDPVITELFDHNNAADRTRTDLYRKYRLDKSKKLILCSTPVLAEHDILSESESMVEVDWFFSELSRSDANVLVSVHPRGDVEQRRTQAAKWGLATLDEPLVSAMPACDVYVSVASSTHRWSMMLGKPAIQLCTWGVINAYEGIQSPTLRTVREKDDLRPMLSEMLKMEGFDADVSTAPIQYFEGAEVMDGKSTERILTALWTLVNEENSWAGARK